MKSIIYYGQTITVSDEVAAFLEEDRLSVQAMERQDRRHLNFVGLDIPSIPDLFTDSPSDPTFEAVFRSLQLENLQTAYRLLSDEERSLLRLYFVCNFTMDQLGSMAGISKMAVSKRIRKSLSRLRDLMIHKAPQIFYFIFRKWFTTAL